MDEVKFAAKIEKPEVGGQLYFVPDERYRDLIKQFLCENRVEAGFTLQVALRMEADEASVRAKNLFHALRDRIVKVTSGHVTKGDKELIKQSLKRDFGPEPDLLFEDVVTSEKTYQLKSTADYTTSEMWQLISGSVARASDLGADIHDLNVEISDLGRILQDESKKKDDADG